MIDDTFITDLCRRIDATAEAITKDADALGDVALDIGNANIVNHADAHAIARGRVDIELSLAGLSVAASKVLLASAQVKRNLSRGPCGEPPAVKISGRTDAPTGGDNTTGESRVNHGP